MAGWSATALQVKGGTYSGVFQVSLPWSLKENFDYTLFVIKTGPNLQIGTNNWPKNNVGK